MTRPPPRNCARRSAGLQAIEDALPYEKRKRVRDDIPVGVYDVIADFGQARGTNTATILPNDALFSRRYGRTILLRENIMKHPDIFAADQRVWRAATVDAHANDLAAEGNFQRTLVARDRSLPRPDRDKQGRTLDVALEDYADAIEEMKSDLVSLFALHRMNHPVAARDPGQRHPPHAAEREAAKRPAVPDDAARAVQLVPRQGPAAGRSRDGAPDHRLRPLRRRRELAAEGSPETAARGRQGRRRGVLRAMDDLDAASCTRSSPRAFATRRARGSGSSSTRRWESDPEPLLLC